MPPRLLRIDDRAALRLVDLIYRAAADPGQWTSFLADLARTIHASTGALAHHDLESHAGAAQWQHGVENRFSALYEHYYSRLNVYMIAAAPWLRSGDIRRGEEAVPDREAVRTEYFNDYMKPLGVLHNVGCCILQEQSVSAMLFVSRALGKDSFGEVEMALLSALLPHLQRAALMQSRLRTAELRADSALAILDRLPTAIFLVDDASSVVFRNAQASALLSAADGLMIARDGLVAGRSVDTAALRKAIRRVTHGLALRWPDVVLPLARPSGRRPLLAVIAAPPAPVTDATVTRTRRLAVVFVVDPDREIQAPAAILEQLYGLTPTEAQVAMRLARGLRLDAVADELSIKNSTARTHLKRILAKTDTRTQSGLMKLVLGGIGQIRLDHLPHLGDSALRGPA